MGGTWGGLIIQEDTRGHKEIAHFIFSCQTAAGLMARLQRAVRRRRRGGGEGWARPFAVETPAATEAGRPAILPEKKADHPSRRGRRLRRSGEETRPRLSRGSRRRDRPSKRTVKYGLNYTPTVERHRCCHCSFHTPPPEPFPHYRLHYRRHRYGAAAARKP